MATLNASQLAATDRPPEEAEGRYEELSPNTVSQVVSFFKLLADETRVRILYALSQNHELNVRALCEELDQSQPAVSHHLALLRVDGLIECRREGKHNFYRIVPDRVGQLLALFAQRQPDGTRLINLQGHLLNWTPQA